MKTTIVTIERLVYGGKGLGYLDRKPVFVPFVLPGEKVKVHIERHHSQFLEAELLEVLEPAPDRIAPPCPYFGKCGGCQWQHINYETQLVWKQKILEETLIRTGKVENPKVLSTIPAPKIWNWRSRITLHSNERGAVGFFEANTHRVVDIENCKISDEDLNLQLKEIRGRTMDHGPWTKRDYELKSTTQLGFTQVNPLQNENLKKLLLEWAKPLPHENIIELFCGGGNFTEILIPLAKKIAAVDSDRNCIEHAVKTLKKENVQFICSDAVRYYAQLPKETPVDLLVLDPPRDGASGVVEGVLKTNPTNILYISCNPATLARDIKYLKDFAGYELVQSQPIDMFPMSYHIECLSWIRQKFVA
ncbi:MAG: class I SAM-dependent RNA methyltransferase [Deltaproteobacteria bacterium]|nr:class I SAM-dependent RNA methyltransferase [Deltaproteobacteria bacterium]